MISRRRRPFRALERGYVHSADGLRHYVRRVHEGGNVTTLCGQRFAPVLGTRRELCYACQRVNELEAAQE